MLQIFAIHVRTREVGILSDTYEYSQSLSSHSPHPTNPFTISLLNIHNHPSDTSRHHSTVHLHLLSKQTLFFALHVPSFSYIYEGRYNIVSDLEEHAILLIINRSISTRYSNPGTSGMYARNHLSCRCAIRNLCVNIYGG